MYQKNSRNITETSPEIINFPHSLYSNPTKVLQNTLKGSRSMITAFLLLFTVFLFLGCESPGVIGEDIISDGDNIETYKDNVKNVTVFEENTFSGRLANTALGHVEDPIFGTITSVALLKPSISRANVDTLYSDDKVHLKLIFNSDVYGHELTVSDFEIFEVDEIWRGNQLRYNKEVEINYSNKIADFQIADEDTVWVEMSPAWTQKFAEYFNDPSAERDSLYRNQFPGVAIVPSQSNQQIRFLKNLIQEEEEEFSTFVVEIQNRDDEDENGEEENGENGDDEENGENDENGEEEEEDDGLRDLGMRDWGAYFVRSEAAPQTESEIVLHSTETVLQVEFDLPADTLRGRNITNAQLILSLDESTQLSDPNFMRPQTNLIRTHVFNEMPRDLQAEIFTTDPSFFVQKDEDEDTFRINITQYVLDEVFGDVDKRKLFLSLQTTNGILYSAKFHGLDAPDQKQPRIVITSVK